MEEELVQMLAGALKMLSAANCSLVGGHTSEGVEAALGFSVTGVVHPQRALVKGPLPRGATLILTKALGELQRLALMSGVGVPFVAYFQTTGQFSLCLF
jgi:selenophosphate synthase